MKAFLIGTASTRVAQLELDRLIARVEHELGPVERIVAQSREGVAKARAYDIVSTPAIAIVRDADGSPVALWQYTMPRFDDIAAYYQPV